MVVVVPETVKSPVTVRFVDIVAAPVIATPLEDVANFKTPLWYKFTAPSLLKLAKCSSPAALRK